MNINAELHDLIFEFCWMKCPAERDLTFENKIFSAVETFNQVYNKSTFSVDERRKKPTISPHDWWSGQNRLLESLRYFRDILSWPFAKLNNKQELLELAV